MSPDVYTELVSEVWGGGFDQGPVRRMRATSNPKWEKSEPRWEAHHHKRS